MTVLGVEMSHCDAAVLASEQLLWSSDPAGRREGAREDHRTGEFRQRDVACLKCRVHFSQARKEEVESF